MDHSPYSEDCMALVTTDKDLEAVETITPAIITDNESDAIGTTMGQLTELVHEDLSEAERSLQGVTDSAKLLSTSHSPPD